MAVCPCLEDIDGTPRVSWNQAKERAVMAESVYTVVELIGTSTESWGEGGRSGGDDGVAVAT